MKKKSEKENKKTMLSVLLAMAEYASVGNYINGIVEEISEESEQDILRFLNNYEYICDEDEHGEYLLGYEFTKLVSVKDKKGKDYLIDNMWVAKNRKNVLLLFDEDGHKVRYRDLTFESKIAFLEAMQEELKLVVLS